MHTLAVDALTPFNSTHENSNADLDRLGDEIAELSAHLEVATARLLDLIRVSGLLRQDGRAGRVVSQSSS